MIDPISNPTAFNRLTLDDREVAVLMKPTGGGDRVQVVEQQQSPGYAGAYTVVKAEKLSEGSYRFLLWESAHFLAFRPWLDTFKAGRKKKPPRVYRLGDPWSEHNEITQVVCSGVSRLLEVSKGLFAYEIHFDEHRKRRRIGGVAVPGKTATDVAIEAQAAENKALAGQLAALQKAAAGGEGAGTFQGLPTP